jgi:hypothetical protein
MTTLREALFLRDLEHRWVLPRLLYAIAVNAAWRGARRLFAFLVTRPSRRVGEFVQTLHEDPGKSEIALAGLAVLVAFVRAAALFLLAVAGLLLAASRL